MDDIKFLRLYRKLNKEQREAVEAIEGPVMAIAGPGTGKTTVLTLRIANILHKTDTPPDAILALTFTESGVRSMRRKLAEIIGAQAYRVHIHTFHGLANDIIKTYPDKFPSIIGAEHMEELEHIRIVEEVLAHGEYNILRPKGDPAYYVTKIISAIKELKKDDITPVSLEALVAAEEKNILSLPDFHHAKGLHKGEVKGVYTERLAQIEKNKELSQVFRAYEEALKKARLYDFEDMILEVVRRLERDSAFRLRLQEEYQYILADEHQDANTAQNKFLELLSSFHEQPNLFIVGDEKQAIFRFQGASLENFLYFKKKFPEARLVVLTENYRSHQIILDASHSLISRSPSRGGEKHVSLHAASDHLPEKVRVIKAVDRPSEIAYVADKVERLLASGVPAKEIAILVRGNKHAEPIEREFRKRAISVSRFADADILDHPTIDAFLTFIRAALHPVEDALVGRAVFSGFLDMDPLTISRLLSRRTRGVSLAETFAADKYTKKFADLLSRCAKIARREPLAEGFEKIAHESRFVEFLLAHPRSHELLPLYGGLLDAVVRHSERDKKATLADFLARLDKASEHGYAIKATHIPPDGVQLLTAHGSKGLEFDHVFIMHGNDGVWGGRKNVRAFALPAGPLSDEEAVSDERRLFYVALTRARKSVTVSFYERSEEGKEKSPSRFVYEIDEMHRTEENAPITSIEDRVSRAPSPVVSAGKDKAYLNALFLERGLSVTHLNNFLQCPWRYFFVDLLRIPRRQDNAALYGTAVHRALKHYFDAYAREEDISPKKAGELFENYLFRTHMSDRDFKEYAREGKKEVVAYLLHYTFPRAIFNEFSIRGVPFRVGKQDILLTGMLDKVEIIRDGVVNPVRGRGSLRALAASNGVNVVDYKTGKPRSRNEIMGNTKNADGNYKRQLVFYKLLLDRYKKGEWRMETGTIDFIKPDTRGKFHREIFLIESDEVKELEKVVSDVTEQILNLSFWNKTCDEKTCEWCRLREVASL